MSIQVTCKFCAHGFQASNELAGGNVKCPQCGASVEIQKQTLAFAEDDKFEIAEEEEQCPLCGAGVASADAECSTCGTLLKSGEISSDVVPFSSSSTIPEKKKSPKNLLQLIGGVVILLFATAVGMYIFSPRTTTLAQLLPADSKVIVLVDLKAIAEADQKGSVKKLNSVFKEFGFAKKFNIDLTKNVHQACFVLGGDLKSLANPGVAVIAKGNFNSKLFDKYASPSNKSAKKRQVEKEYKGHSILRLVEKKQNVYCVLLTSNTLVGSNKVEMIEEIISIHKGKAKSIALDNNNQFLFNADPYFIKIHGVIPQELVKKFSEKIPEQFKPYAALETITWAIEGTANEPKMALSLSFADGNAAASLKGLYDQSLAKFKEEISGVDIPQAKDLQKYIELIEVEVTDGSFTIAWQGDEKSKAFSQWLVEKNGWQELGAAYQWKSIQDTSLDPSQKAAMLQEFLAYFPTSKYVTQANEMLAKLQSKGQEEEAQASYLKIVDEKNLFKRWLLMQQFPKQYALTEVGKKVAEEIKEVQQKLFGQAAEVRETLETMSEDSEFSGFVEVEQKIAYLLAGDVADIRHSLGRIDKDFNKNIGTVRQLYASVQKAKLEQEQKSRQDKEQQTKELKQELDTWLKEQFFIVIADRKYREAYDKLGSLKKRWQKLEGSKKIDDLISARRKDVNELNKMRKTIAKFLQLLQKRHKTVSLTSINGKVYYGKITKVIKSKFQIKTSKGAPILGVEKIRAYYLSEKIIPKKGRDPKTNYYLALMLYADYYKAKQNSSKLTQTQKDSYGLSKKYLVEALKGKYAPAKKLLEMVKAGE